VSRILITSGPTREYLDPVRYLSNASSGRMGRALAAAALAAGHEVVIVSGPVQVEYPSSARVLRVVSTEEMLRACQAEFPACDGVIGAAAPCDYRPEQPAAQKIAKSGGPWDLRLVETPDVLSALAAMKGPRWMVAFALETGDRHARALEKLRRKRCDLIVVNGPAAIHAHDTQVEVLDGEGRVLAFLSGTKEEVARALFRILDERLIRGVAGG